MQGTDFGSLSIESHSPALSLRGSLALREGFVSKLIRFIATQGIKDGV
jgi:hypothetical protein